MQPGLDEDGSGKTFGVWHPIQMLQKLAWEESLASDMSCATHLRIFAMMNAFATAWHMIEWTWESLGPVTRQRLGTTKPGAYRTRVLARCPELALCQQMGNGGKHRRLTRFNNPMVRSKIDYVIRLRRGHENGIEAVNFTDNPKIYEDDRKLDPLEVIGVVRAFWISEFEALSDLHRA